MHVSNKNLECAFYFIMESINKKSQIYKLQINIMTIPFLAMKRKMGSQHCATVLAYLYKDR